MLDKTHKFLMMARRRSGCTVSRAVLRADFLCRRVASVRVRFVPSAREEVVQEVEIGKWVLRGGGMVGLVVILPVVLVLALVVGGGRVSLVRSMIFLAIVHVFYVIEMFRAWLMWCERT